MGGEDTRNLARVQSGLQKRSYRMLKSPALCLDSVLTAEKWKSS